MSLTVTITGADGFVGHHLARLAHAAGHRVIGVARAAAPDAALAPHLAEYHTADLRTEWPDGIRTDVVIHLAGLAAVGPSFANPQAYLDGNSAMVTTMCESLLRGPAGVRILGVSTGAVYGAPLAEAPQTEESPLGFTSPYAVSKVLVENQLAYYRRRGLDTVVARPFNHIGPGQSPGFIVPDLIDRVRGLTAGEPLPVGDLSTRRDYTDVRDVARAYLALVTAPTLQHTVYNVASGAARSGSEILAAICAALHTPLPDVRVDTDRIRATDPPVIVGDATRIMNELGWAPDITIEQSISDSV